MRKVYDAKKMKTLRDPTVSSGNSKSYLHARANIHIMCYNLIIIYIKGKCYHYKLMIYLKEV